MTTPGRFRCPRCDRRFRDLGVLNAHLRHCDAPEPKEGKR